MSSALRPRSYCLRPETPADEAFAMALFASTRAAEIAYLAGAAAARETFVRLQFLAQQQAFKVCYPAAERSIVEIDGTLAGRLVVDRSNKETRLVDIAFLPEYRGRGTGTALLVDLLNESTAAGRSVALHVIRGSPAARLYARLGFMRTGGTGMHDVMEWRLAGAMADSL